MITKFYLAIFIGYFFARNIFMPLCYDDYAYAFIWDGTHGGNLDAMQIDNSQRIRVENLSDILISQYSHYFNWGGRIIGHTLAQIFILLGKNYFNIANTIIMIIFVFVILKIANIKLRDSKFLIIWIFFNLFVIGAIFGETLTWTTWLTGTCNYFWLTVAQIIFLYFYIKPHDINIFVISLLGIISGWATEAGSLATIFCAGIFIIRAWRKNLLQKYMLAGFIFLIIGCALNILSPGNFNQLDFIQSVNPHFKFSAELFLYHIHHAFIPIILIDLFALLPAIYFFIMRGKNFVMMNFAAAGFIVPCAMLFSPKFELRTTIISLIFILVSSAIAIAELKISAPKLCRILTIISILYFIPALYANFLLYRENNLQLEYIEQHRADKIIVMPKFNSPPNYNLPPINSFAGITNNENYCINIMVAQYYGVKKILGGN